MLRRLAEVPGPRFFAGGQLQVAAGHVEAAGIAEDGLDRVLRRDAERRAAERDHQLRLVVEILGPERMGIVAPESTMASAGFMKNQGASRSTTPPISLACSA